MHDPGRTVSNASMMATRRWRSPDQLYVVTCIRERRMRRPGSVVDHDCARGLVAEALVPVSENEDPVQRTEKGEQQIAHERLTETARRAGRSVDHSRADVPLPEALTSAQPVGEEIVAEGPQQTGEQKHQAERVAE